jgi:hypothetical protein
VSCSASAIIASTSWKLSGKIQTLTGQDAQTACSGFKNIGQSVAAAHVAKNLDIPGGFDALKMRAQVEELTGQAGLQILFMG